MANVVSDVQVLLTVKEAQKLAPAIGIDRIRRAAGRKEFKAKRDGNRYLIGRDSYVVWLKGIVGADVVD